jgi:tetratricopeptide (TPR) repeat protein
MVFNDSPMQLSDAMAADAAQGLKWYTIASSIGDGGIGLLRTWQWKIDLQQAWLHSARHEFADAEAVIRRAISRDGPNEDTVRSLIWVMFAEHKEREALDLTEPMLLEREDYASSLDSFGQMAGSIGQLDRAVKLNQRRLEKYPNHLHTMRVLSLQLLSDNKVQEGVDMIRKTLEVEPNNASARYFLALGLAELNQMDEAEKEMREAARLDPNSVPINSMLANLLEQKGQHDEAETYRQKAQQLKDQAQRAHSE